MGGLCSLCRFRVKKVAVKRDVSKLMYFQKDAINSIDHLSILLFSNTYKGKESHLHE